MSLSLEQIEAEVLQLPLEQQGQLLSRLLAALDPGDGEDPSAIEAAWDAEIAHRLAELEAGRAVPVPYEEVRLRLQEALDRHTASR